MLQPIPFLLFGQSNMFGADAIVPEPWEYWLSDERSSYYRQNGPTLTASTDLEPTRGLDGSLTHGPETGFARYLQPYMPGRYVLAKYTNNIEANEPAYLWSMGQRYMDATLELFQDACSAQKIPAIPQAILIEQGIDEAASPIRWNKYRDNFRGLINDLRTYFGKPDLRIVIANSVNSPLVPSDRMKYIRDVQREIAGLAKGTPIPGVFLVNVDDQAPFVNYHHLTEKAQIVFGQRFAWATIGQWNG